MLRLPSSLRLAVALLLLLAAALPAAAQRSSTSASSFCYVVADSPLQDGGDVGGQDDAFFALVNIYTGDEYVIGATGTLNVEAIALDPQSGILYAADADQLGTIDLNSGVFTPRPHTFGGGHGSLGLEFFDDVDGLSFDLATGALYGSLRRVGHPDLLFQIDPVSGLVAQDAFGPNIEYVVIDPVTAGHPDIDDLAFDPATGFLYATANDDGFGDHLVRIDPATGATTDLGAIRDASGQALENFEGLTVNPEGALIGLQGGNSKGIYQLDKTTAQATLLSTLSSASDYESISCLSGGTDLRIDKTVDNAAPIAGEHITFTVKVTNEGTATGTGIVVKDVLPAGLVFVSATPSQGTYDAGSGLWNVGSLDAGQMATLTIVTEVEADPENCAEIMAADQPDPDSVPGNGIRSEDDLSCVTVTIGTTSGGGDAGVESEGTLATDLARRLFERRQDARARQALRAAPSPERFDAASRPAFAAPAAGKQGSFAMTALIPQTGPQQTTAYVVTPADLLGLTNATSVFAADYLRPEGRRLAALFGATSPQTTLYDHTKAICDRLGGGHLEEIRHLDVNGHPFVLFRLVHADGAVDYAVSFVAYRTGNRFTVDSRFAQQEYAVPPESEEVVNLQVWSVTPQYTAELVAGILERMGAQGDVTFLNNGDAAPAVPGVFVRDGYYDRGRLVLNVMNTGGAAQATFQGLIARTEIEAETKQRETFEYTVALPAPAPGERTVTVELPLGALFDVVFTLEDPATGALDQLYYADGPWSYLWGEQSHISAFETYAYDEAAAPAGRYVVERSASLAGEVSDWVSLFRYLRPGGQPIDLSHHEYIEFTAYGQGQVHLVLEKASIDTWDHFGYTFTLQPEARTYRIWFDELRRSSGASGFRADDLTLLAFYVSGGSQAGRRFELNIHDVSFGGGTSVDREDGAALPQGYALSQNYPNPFNPTTQVDYELPAAGPVRLAVYDLLGREVALLVDEVRPAGLHAARFDAADLPSGTYLYRLETPQRTFTRTMTLIK